MPKNKSREQSPLLATPKIPPIATSYKLGLDYKENRRKIQLFFDFSFCGTCILNRTPFCYHPFPVCGLSGVPAFASIAPLRSATRLRRAPPIPAVLLFANRNKNNTLFFSKLNIFAFHHTVVRIFITSHSKTFNPLALYITFLILS